MDTTELQNQAIEIRDAENEGENTATKVGTLLVNIIQALNGTVTEESLTETLKAIEEALQRDYASLENGTVKWHQRGVIMLKSMGSALDNIDGGSYTPTFEIGDTWFSPTSGGLKHRTQDGDEAWSVRPDAVYINSHTLRVYKWASGSMVELGSGKNPVMIDYMVSKTLDSIAVGEVFWQSSNLKLVIKTGASTVRMFSPDPSVIYCARDTKSLMFWDTTTSTWQSVGGGASSGLTKVISNIELVNSKVNTLINALANIAFKQLPKPEMTELDWGGAKHTVTINNTLSGCSADKSGTQQVSEDSALVVTITADSGKLLRSVSASSGTVVIAANKTTATVTLTVNDDVTLTIQASATNADSFTASISDSRVSGTGATSGITEGSSWTSVLSLNNTADPSDDITNVTVEMVGGGSGSISAEVVNGVWTVHTDCVTGNITITVTVAGVVKHNVSWQGSGFKMYADTNHTTELTSPVQVNEGSSFTAYIAADEDVTIDSVTGANYDSSTGLVQISNVSANAVISVSTTNSNPDYKNIRADGKTYIWGDSSGYFMSKLIPLGVRGENDEESDGLSVAFKTSYNSTGAVNGKLLLFLSDKSYYDSYGASNAKIEREVAPINKYKYARLTGKIEALANAYVKINGTTVWNGAQKDITDFEPPENFMTNPLSEAEIDGQGVRKKTMHTYPGATSYYGYPDNAKKGLLGAALITAPASTWDYALTPKYEIPKKVVGANTTTRKLKVSIKSHNSVISDRTSYIRLEKIENGEVKKSAYINSQSSAFDIDLSSLVFVQGGTIYTEGDTLAEGAETVNGTEFTHVQMCFNYANKSSCYIKYYDDGDELIDIWNGNPQT